MSKSNDKKFKHFRRRFRLALKNPLTYLILLMLAVIVLATWIVNETETQTDSGITGWFDSIWHTIVAIVAAYYDYYVKSVPGRLASIVLLLLGMALSSIVTASATSVIMNIQMKKNKGLKKIKKMKGHFLLCGWRPGFEKILESVLNSNADIDVDSIVLVNNAPTEEMEKLKSDIKYADIKYINGDFSDTEILKKAYIDTAERALVIADSSKKCSEMETDSQTVLAVLSIKNLNPKVYIAAELLDEKFEEHIRLAHCDEVILTQNYQHSLLATASSGMGYSNVIKNLISDDSDSGVIVADIPKKYEGKTYGALFAEVEAGKIFGNSILIGVVSSGKTSKYEPMLTPGDDLVLNSSTKAILVKAKAAV